MLQLHRGGGYRRPIPHVDVNGARLWVEEAGSGPAVLFLHGGLGDLRLWQPQLRSLADEFRCIAYDRRFYGRTEAPAARFSSVDDVVALLDVLAVDRAALVGLSAGGDLALDVASAHAARVTKLAHVCAGVTGIPVDPYTEEQDERFERGDDDEKMAVDFEVWAPLGIDGGIRDMWLQTPDARGVPEGAIPAPRPDVVLEEVRVPTLVITARHDPPAQRAAGEEAARRIPGARHIEIDSDHYLTLREPERVTRVLREFLAR